MLVTILGSGTSTGVPQIGCDCEVCRSTDPRDHRLRCSALIENGEDRILIDCGPDFRQQMLPMPNRKISGVLITHEHYDHVGGLDDLRPFSVFGDVDVYAEDYCANHLIERIPYCFTPKEKRYPGVPAITLHRINPGQEFYIGKTRVLPLRVIHGNLPILGFRISNMAYITDMSSYSEDIIDALNGVETLVLNALRHEKHPSHQTVDEAISFARRVGAKNTYLIHMSHHVGLHEENSASLPVGIELAYDGLTIDVPS